MKSHTKEEVRNYIWILIGSILFCGGLNLFIVPVGLYNGGTVGISQIIRTLIQAKIDLPAGFDIAGIINFIINVPLLLLAYKSFGRNLVLKTIFSVVTQTIFFTIIPIPSTPILSELIAACIIGGLLAGAGVGVTLRAGGSGGGNDVLGLYFTKKFEGFSVGKMTLIINALVYLTCAILFELPTAIYSIIYSAVYSLTVDRVHLQNINVNVEIFTKEEHLYKEIIGELKRGTTSWKAIGGYTDSDTYVVVTIISKYEISQLKQLLLEKDPHAFVIVNECPEIFGNYEKRL